MRRELSAGSRISSRARLPACHHASCRQAPAVCALWHWAHYQDAMYPVMEREGEEYCLRPMNCPHHIMIYAAEPHSYRELPMRLAELANMHRWEKSGQVSGMSRVRIMTSTTPIFSAPMRTWWKAKSKGCCGSWKRCGDTRTQGLHVPPVAR